MAELASTPGGGSAASPVEGDFSPRKIRIATAVLIGQTFGTSILPYSAFSLLMIPLTREFGWTRTQFSFATTFIFIFGAMSLVPIGRIADKIGVRPVILIGTSIVALITLALSFQTASLFQLYACYAALGIFGSTGVAYTKIIAALFTQNRGKALAILGAESTVAAAIVPLVTNALLLNFGWRHMYWAFAAIIAAIVPVLYFTLDEPGRPAGALWGRKPAGARPPPPAPPALDGMSISQVMKDWVFWMIVLSGLVSFVVLSGMQAHMIPALIGKGFSQTQAVETTSVSLLVGLAGALVGGYVVDRFHTPKVAVSFNVLAAVSALLLLIVTATTGGPALLFAAVALSGFAGAAFRPMATYFQTRYFGLAAFTQVSALQFTITNPVTAFAAPAIGAIYDRTHSYALAFMLMIAAPLVSAAVWMLLPKYRYSANIGEAPPPPPE